MARSMPPRDLSDAVADAGLIILGVLYCTVQVYLYIMRHFLYLLAITFILASCNSPEPAADPDVVDPTTETAAEEQREEGLAITTDEALIATALMAAPEASRAGAKVIGYNMAGEFVTLREGTNEFICLADDPQKEGFSAACYHQDLEPFMARGREMKAEGITGQALFDAREEEVKAGKLSMGPSGTTLHVYSGPQSTYDPATKLVDEAKYRYVVYMPYATAASTGLPEAPIAPNHPWLMDPGTHRAHIMISPLAGE